MLNRFKSALYNVVGNFEISEGTPDPGQSNSSTPRHNGFARERPLKHKYTRPDFLQLSNDEEILVTADQTIRPIICPRDNGSLPWNVGYAETINAGKSKKNEDQAAFHKGYLRKVVPNWANPGTISLETETSHCNIDEEGSLVIELPYYYFGVFDGHAGWGAAVSASKELHDIIDEKLMDAFDLLLPEIVTVDQKEKASGPLWYMERTVTPESAVVGALEQAFVIMDSRIGEDIFRYQISGGCTACIGLFILGTLYVANAGDSRGILCKDQLPYPMSFDFTPETEVQRVKKLGALQPELMGGDFTHLEFLRRPMRRDLGKRAAFRDHYMTGWGYKTITHDDLKYPLVCGEGKRSRVMATIGVTRGFGDHHLRAQSSGMPIKPFLSPEPEVRLFELKSSLLLDSDVLVLATDGLWDITSNEVVSASVCNSIKHFPLSDVHRHKYRYTTAAQDLVMCSRGKMKDHSWRTAEDKHATIDDISVFVIPLKPYQEEYSLWEKNFKTFISLRSVKSTKPQEETDPGTPAAETQQNGDEPMQTDEEQTLNGTETEDHSKRLEVDLVDNPDSPE